MCGGLVQVAPVQAPDLLARVVEVALVGDDVVGDGQPLGAARLCRQDAARLRLGFGVSREKARNLGFFLAVNDEYAVHEGPQRRLEQQWHDNDLVGSAGGVWPALGSPHRILGCSMASSLRRASSSPNTRARIAGRSSVPSSAITPAPNASRISCSAG